MADIDATDSLTTFTAAEALQLAEIVADAVGHALGGQPMFCQFDPATGIFTLRAVIPDDRVLH